MSAAKKATNTLDVYSVMPHSWSVAIPVKHGTKGQADYHVSFREVRFDPGDNQIAAEDWDEINKLPAVKHHLEQGNLAQGRIIKASSHIREMIWDGRVDANGIPQLASADKTWIKRLSPKAMSVTDTLAKRVSDRGVIVLTDDELKNLGK